MKYDLGGRTVAITGSAGGLGSALAEALRERKANLALLDLSGDAVAEQAERLGGRGVARGWQVDVRELGSVEAAMRQAAEHFGRLDVVIANAGIGEMVGPLLEARPEDWDRTIDINLTGVWRTLKAALPHVQLQRGHLLAISSTAAFVHMPGFGAYPASKAGVWAMCDTIRLELRHTGVTVGSVHPTWFKTPMMEAALEEPAVMRLCNGFEGMWKLAPKETVVRDIVRGIERRSAHVVTPRNVRPLAFAPGVAQAVIERIGFRGDTIPEALELYLQARAGTTGLAPPRSPDTAPYAK